MSPSIQSTLLPNRKTSTTGDALTVSMGTVYVQPKIAEEDPWEKLVDMVRTSVETHDVRLGEPQATIPYRGGGAILVAPGILVEAQEYQERYGGFDLKSFRERMSPELFKAFVRHIGSVPGYAEMDIDEITTILD